MPGTSKSDLEDVNTVAAAAAYLKLTECKVVEVARSRRLGAIKEGRAWLFARAALLAYVESNTQSVVATVRPHPARRGRTFP